MSPGKMSKNLRCEIPPIVSIDSEQRLSLSPEDLTYSGSSSQNKYSRQQTIGVASNEKRSDIDELKKRLKLDLSELRCLNEVKKDSHSDELEM